MDIAGWILVGLLLWIFSLQNRLKSLEEVVSSLQDKLTGLHIEREARIEEAREQKELDKDIGISNENQSQKSISSTIVLAETMPHNTADTPNVRQRPETISPPPSVETLNPQMQPVWTPVTLPEKLDIPEPVSARPSEPLWIIQMVTRYFTGGNLLVRIGGVVLFFGLAFLVKYAAEHSTLSMSERLVMIALLAVGLIVGGWILRFREGAYGQILQGLGIAILYLVIYGSARFYNLLSLEAAFALMLVIVIIGSLLALIQNSLPLVLFAVTGGFAAPILTSSGQGSHVVLFGYYALLNLSIFFMAWYRSWRILNLTGFLFTFIISTGWGVLRYHSELFSTTEPFLILYFLMYLTISILFTRRGEKHLVDSTLIFGLPAVAFPLQVVLTEPFEYGAGWSAIAMGTLYLLLASRFRRTPHMGLLFTSFLGLGVLFLTMAVPYFFDADVTAAIWAMESSAVIWLALRQSRALPRYLGEILLLISLVLYLLSMTQSEGITLSEYLGYAIVYLSLFVTACHLKKHALVLHYDVYMPSIVLLLSLVVWFISASEVAIEWDRFAYGHIMMLFVIALSLLLTGTSRWISWSIIPPLLQATLPLGMLFGVMQFGAQGTSMVLPHPFAGIGLLVWFGLFGWHGYLLYQYREQWPGALPLHVASFWGAILVLTLELRWQVSGWRIGHSATFVATSLLPLVSTLWVHQRVRFDGWMAPYRMAYRLIGVGGVTGVLALWQLFAFFHTSDCTLIPYVPILNLLDLAQLAVLTAASAWVYLSRDSLNTQIRNILSGVLAGTGFLLLNIVFARAVHHYLLIPYTGHGLWHSLFFQTGITILWSVTAIVLMLFSRRYTHRRMWMAGFGLLGLVVVKLFFVELANSGTIERIVSFIVVGALLLLIGYFVPLPPEGEREPLDKEA